MDPQKRASIIQRIIKILKELKKPDWFVAEKIAKEILEPEIQEVQDQYERLFFTNDSDKH
jgi:hypothetical protein